MAACGAALERIFDRLSEEAAAAGGRCELYCSLACGADQVAVQIADSREMPVHLILPKPVRDENGGWLDQGGFGEDFSDSGLPAGPEIWARAVARIRLAEAAWQGGSCRVVRHSGTEPECYYDMALQIMDAADAVVLVWDKARPARGLGGTEDYVSLARQRRLPLKYWNPETGIARSERCELFPPLEGLDHLRELNAAVSIAAGKGSQRPWSAETLFHLLDAAACQSGAGFRGHAVRKIYLHAAAAATGAVAALVAGSGLSQGLLIALAALESFILFRIMRHSRRVSRAGLQPLWIRSRFAAELLRAQLAARDLLDPLHLPIASHPHPEWRRFALSAALLAHAEEKSCLPWQQARDLYVRDRLRDPSWQQGQIAHFRHQHESAAGRSERLAEWSRHLTAVAAVFVLGSLAYRIWKAGGYASPPPSPWPFLLALCFSFLPVVLPLAAGMCLSLRTALDSGRRARQYAHLFLRLESAAATIGALRTESATRRAVLAAEEILLNELFEWKLAAEQNSGR